jgi:hypothetical protein
MSEKMDNTGRRETPKNGSGNGQDALANALSFEKEKNKILLDQVISLEDALVNRQMAEFDAVISDDTREFWREQLLANREKAEVALGELSRLGGDGGRKPEDGGQKPESGGRRPLHNRQTARPVRPGERDSGGAAAGKAVKIRNRAHELSKTEGIPFSTAFRRAEREVGEQS